MHKTIHYIKSKQSFRRLRVTDALLLTALIGGLCGIVLTKPAAAAVSKTYTSGSNVILSVPGGGGGGGGPAPTAYVTRDGGFGRDHACLLTLTGKIYCAGAIRSQGIGSRLGNNSSSNSTSLVQFGGNDNSAAGIANRDRIYTQVAAGSEHTCGLAIDQKIYCSGEGGRGELGRRISGDSIIPVEWGRDNSTGVSFNKKFVKVVLGAKQTCGLATDQLIYCTGHNSNGELGRTNPIPGPIENGTNEARLPVQWGPSISKKYTAIATKSESFCALTTDQLIYCSGENANGELGDDTIGTNRFTPVPWGTTSSSASKNEKYLDLMSSTRHTCGLTITLQVYCSGSNEYGERGIGAPTGNQDALTPEIASYAGLTAGEKVVKFTATDSAHCVLTTKQLAYCTGRNAEGQFGVNNTNIYGSLVEFGRYGGTGTIGKVTNIIGSANRLTGGFGDGYVCAVKVDQTIWCSGGNSYGQFGNGNTSSTTTPVQAFTTFP